MDDLHFIQETHHSIQNDFHQSSTGFSIAINVCVILPIAMKKSFIWAFVALVFLGGGCFTNSESPDLDEVASGIDRDSILFVAQQNGLIMNDEEIADMEVVSPREDLLNETSSNIQSFLGIDVSTWSSVALADVTSGGSFGIGHRQYKNGEFTMIVNMGNLPEPAEDYFYEGWLVHRGADMSILSTGRAVKTEKGFTNVYVTNTDLAESDFYVLTLEPDDGNPAPAEHILEGTFK